MRMYNYSSGRKQENQTLSEDGWSCEQRSIFYDASSPHYTNSKEVKRQKERKKTKGQSEEQKKEEHERQK